ncbi:hypothetical protein AL534_020740 [Vibrio cholerae]|nr:hypothetical protein AL534_020740 [Vibrio cholerae]
MEKFPTNANVYLGKLTLFIVRYHLSQKKNQTLALHVLCLELLVNHNFVSFATGCDFPRARVPPYGQGVLNRRFREMGKKKRTEWKEFDAPEKFESRML